MSRRVALRTVFLSSSARDLGDHRTAVHEAIAGLDHYHCVRMEDFGARSRQPDEFCQTKVSECDVFVGLIGHIYGDSPEEDGASYTEREYEAAIREGKPLLIFLARDDFALPALLVEADDRRVKQQRFRDRVRQNAVRAQFTSPSDLALRVVQSIRKLGARAGTHGVGQS